MRRYPLFHGRLADLCIALDTIDPGFLGYVRRLSHRRAQAALCTLAITGEAALSCDSDHFSGVSPEIIALKPVATAIRKLGIQELLATYVGPHEEGLIGALEKLPSGVQPAKTYRTLVEIFANPEQRRVASVIRHLQSLSAQRIDILLTLDPIFLVPRFTAKVGTIADAADINTALGLIRNVVPSADDAALSDSIRSIGPSTSLSDWVVGWIGRADSVPHLRLELGPDYVPLDSCAKLIEAGRRYRVCLGHAERLVLALRGRAFHYEHVRRRAIVTVEAIGPEQSFLVLAGVHSIRNRFMSASVRAGIERDFRRVGIVPTYWISEDTPWSAVERIVSKSLDIEYVDEDELTELAAEFHAAEAAE